MQSKGVRRILIALFLVLNIAFLCMYLYEYRSSEYVDEEFVLAAVENLSARGISVSNGVFDTQKPNLPAGKIVVSHDKNVARVVSDEIAKFTLGNVDVRIVEFDTPEGISLSFYNDDMVSSNMQLAKTFFSHDGFGFQYSDFRYEKETQAPGIPVKTISKTISYDEKKILNDFALCFGKTLQLGYRICGCRIYDDGTLFTLVQTFEGVDIENMYMNILLWNGEILSAKGSWISSKTEKNYRFEMIDGVNAVFTLPLDKVEQIVSQRPIYATKRSDENTYYLLPMWEITYVDVEGKEITSVVENVN